MLTSTFVHLNGIGPSTERRLWEGGIADWTTFRREPNLPGISPSRKVLYDIDLASAQEQLDRHNARYFADCLHTRDHWRLFPPSAHGHSIWTSKRPDCPPARGR
jgi:hypothetical protein